MNAWGASAALYRSTVRHTRFTPFEYRLRHRTYQWLVDLDDLPRPPWPLRWLAGFRSRDHLGDPDRSIRDNLDGWLREQGVDLAGGKVWMLANARVFGYTFNPLTVFWCQKASGEPACVVAEVHNTYSQRHCYLLRTDVDGLSRTEKRFYVSPFNPVDGQYDMRLPPPGERLKLAITYRRRGDRAFIATVSGRRRAASTSALLAAAIRHPFSTLAVTAAIRWHGIRLYLRGLAVVPRSATDRKA